MKIALMIAVLLVSLVGVAAAEAPAFRLELKPAEGLPSGKVETLQGTAKTEPDQFFVEHIGVLQPVVVTLFAAHKGDKIKMVLAKERWDEKLQEHVTGPEGQVTAKLRTQGELRIIVTAEGEPKPYFLMVWVGDEVKVELASVIVPMSTHTRGAGTSVAGGSTLSIVLAVGVVALLVMIVVFAMRKRLKAHAAAAGLVLMILLDARPVLAGPALPPSMLSPADMESRLAAARATDREASEAGGAGTASGIATGIQWGQWGVDAVTTARELLDAFHALHVSDATCMDLSTAGAPALPASCESEAAPCHACYTSAYRQLNGMRLNLERLRCYYTAGKNVADRAIAFGDSTSGIHAVTGLAWQNARAEIQAASTSLDATYDTKYGQMIPNLQAALQAIGKCEQTYFNSPDWYARFGYIYMTFLADRYKRAR
jgi:hypothetical protein